MINASLASSLPPTITLIKPSRTWKIGWCVPFFKNPNLSLLCLQAWTAKMKPHRQLPNAKIDDHLKSKKCFYHGRDKKVRTACIVNNKFTLNFWRIGLVWWSFQHAIFQIKTPRRSIEQLYFTLRTPFARTHYPSKSIQSVPYPIFSHIDSIIIGWKREGKLLRYYLISRVRYQRNSHHTDTPNHLTRDLSQISDIPMWIMRVLRPGFKRYKSITR